MKPLRQGQCLLKISGLACLDDFSAQRLELALDTLFQRLCFRLARQRLGWQIRGATASARLANSSALAWSPRPARARLR